MLKQNRQTQQQIKKQIQTHYPNNNQNHHSNQTYNHHSNNNQNGLINNRLPIFNKTSHMKKVMYIQPQKTSNNNMDDSCFEFQFQLRSKELMQKVKPQYSLNILKNSKTALSPRKEFYVHSKELNAINILSMKVLQQQPIKATFRTKKKLSIIPFKTSRSLKTNIFKLKDKIKQQSDKYIQNDKFEKIRETKQKIRLETRQKLRNNNLLIERQSSQKNKSFDNLTIQEMIESDFILLKEQKIDFQIYTLKIKKEQAKRKIDNIIKWSTFSYGNIPQYLAP